MTLCLSLKKCLATSTFALLGALIPLVRTPTSSRERLEKTMWRGRAWNRMVVVQAIKFWGWFFSNFCFSYLLYLFCQRYHLAGLGEAVFEGGHLCGYIQQGGCLGLAQLGCWDSWAWLSLHVVSELSLSSEAEAVWSRENLKPALYHFPWKVARWGPQHTDTTKISASQTFMWNRYPGD